MNPIVPQRPETVIEQRQETSLESATKQFEESRREARAIRGLLQEAREGCIDYEEYKQLKKKVKGLKDYIDNEEEVAKQIDKLKGVNERRKLLKEIIAVKMKEQQLSLFEGEGTFSLKDTIVYKPKVEKKEKN